MVARCTAVVCCTSNCVAVSVIRWRTDTGSAWQRRRTVSVVCSIDTCCPIFDKKCRKVAHSRKCRGTDLSHCWDFGPVNCTQNPSPEGGGCCAQYCAAGFRICSAYQCDVLLHGDASRSPQTMFLARHTWTVEDLHTFDYFIHNLHEDINLLWIRKIHVCISSSYRTVIMPFPLYVTLALLSFTSCLYAKLIDNFSHESDVTSLKTPF